MMDNIDAGTSTDKQAEESQVLKAPALNKDQVGIWLSRCKTSLKFHRREILPKYKQARRRYNSEIGYAGINYSQNVTRAKAQHTDINLLFRDIKNFISSIFYRNPQIELTARTDDEETQVNIQNLGQAVNDDIQDREKEIKALLRSCLVDECLAGLGGLYIDYDYNHREVTDEQGQPIVDPQLQTPQIEVLSNKVVIKKVKPENIIRPPWIYYYNYKEAPYLGYVDIVSIDSLKANSSLNQEVVKSIKGGTYRSLLDYDTKDLEKSYVVEDKDDLLHAKIYTIFIKGNDGGPVKRLILVDDPEVKDQYLAYDDLDKGHGRDGKGYPLHILMLNDASDTFIPPSEAWILEPILQVIDHIFGKINRHLKKSSTKTFIKTGEQGVEKTEVDKLIRNNDLEYIPVQNLPPGVDVGTLINQVVDQPLSQDHDSMFMLARRIFDELSRQPSFSQASILNQRKTATETAAIQQTDSTENGDYIDKFKDFLCDVFYDWAKLLQQNMQGAKTVSIVDEVTGNKDTRQDITAENMQGEFKADINVTSFLQPNKELKRKALKDTLGDLTIFAPFLKQVGKTINGKKAVDELLANVDVRNPQAMLMNIPIRDIYQQVVDLAFHNQPMNPGELGDDPEKALASLTQIFQDDTIMGALSQINPEIGNPQGQVVQMLQFLDGQKNQGAKTKQRPSGQPASAKPPTDTGMEARQLAEGQR